MTTPRPGEEPLAIAADIRRIAQRDYDEDDQSGGRIQDAADALASLTSRLAAVVRERDEARADADDAERVRQEYEDERDEARTRAKAADARLGGVARIVNALRRGAYARLFLDFNQEAALRALAAAPVPPQPEYPGHVPISVHPEHVVRLRAAIDYPHGRDRLTDCEVIEVAADQLERPGPVSPQSAENP